MTLEFLRIKEVIKQSGETYETLGQKVGLTKTSIARIASGDQTPSFEMLKKIAETLNCGIQDLFVDSGKEGLTPIFKKNTQGELVEIGYLKD